MFHFDVLFRNGSRGYFFDYKLVNIWGSPSLLGIAEFMVPTGSFFHAQTHVLIPYYRRAFPKCEDEPYLA
jgi:hypothetical protein